MKSGLSVGILLAAFLSGCGGGSDVEDALLPPGVHDIVTGGDLPSGTPSGGDCGDMEAAYGRITKGMSPDQVKAVMGCAAHTQSEYNGAIAYLMYWDYGRGCRSNTYVYDCDYEYVWVSFDVDYSTWRQGGASWKQYMGRGLHKTDQL